jgi:hypothetical protein
MMKTSYRAAIAAATLILLPALALAQAPTIGTLLSNRKVNQDQDPGWGAIDGTSWQTLPQRMMTINIDGKRVPLCVSRDGSGEPGLGWVGLAQSLNKGAGKSAMRCVTSKTTTNGGWVFEYKGNSAPLWINTTSATPEPFGAIALAVQSTKRPLYACQFKQGSEARVGHIGDDGKCYGAGNSSATTYLVMVSSGTGQMAQPRYGWVPASNSYTPSGTLATGGVNVAGGDLKACRVSDGGMSWPGWLNMGTCTYYVYFGNKTTPKTSRTFELFRVKPGAAKAPYVFNRFGGKAFYACRTEFSVNGNTKHVLFGFTNNTGSCTNGTLSSDVKPDKFGGWSPVRLLELPVDSGDRA